jgi:hypothetical protein
MSDLSKKKDDQNCGEVNFTIDGRSFSVFDRKQAPGDLLQLAGLDPCGYDLARVRDGHPPKRFDDDDRVRIRDGDKFVSVRERAAVA